MNLLEGVRNVKALSDATAGKGLENYDPSNALETTLKNLVNSIKYTLDDLVEMFNINILGLDLGGSK